MHFIDDVVEFTVNVTGSTDGRITKEQVLEVYNYLLKKGHHETDENFYDLMLSWLEGDIEIETDLWVNEYSISEGYRQDVIDFIKEIIQANGVNEDEYGQTHLFNPEVYEVNEYTLKRQQEEELEAFLRKGR